MSRGSGHLSQPELESYLWGAANLLRGLIDTGDYKQYVFPLLFFKRLSDVWDEEYRTALDETGDESYILKKEHRVPLRDRLASDEARLAALERNGPGGDLKSSFAQAQGDLASLSARVGKLETAPDPQATARLDDMDRRLSAARGDTDLRLAALERNALGSDLPQRIAALTSAQAALEARVIHLETIEPSVTMKRAGRRPLRSSVAPIWRPSVKAMAAGPSHGSISAA